MTAHVQGCRSPEDHEGICRDASGKPRIILPDGKTVRSYSRASSFGDALDDKGGLIAWSQANAVRGALTVPAIGQRFLAVDDGWVTPEAKDATKAVITEAAVAGGSEVKANKGTDIHGWTEALDKGEDVDVPPEFAGDLMAYEYATEEMDHLVIEEFTVLDDFRIGGTPDRITRWADHPCPECELDTYVFDLKTGSVTYPGKMAVQLAVYSRAVRYTQETDVREQIAYASRTPLPETCQHRAIILNLPAGSGQASVYWIDIAEGWRAIQEIIPQVKAWRSGQKALLTPA